MTSGRIGRRGQVPQRMPTGMATTSATRQATKPKAPLPWTFAQTTGMSGTTTRAAREPAPQPEAPGEDGREHEDEVPDLRPRDSRPTGPMTIPSATSERPRERRHASARRARAATTSGRSRGQRPASATRLVPISPAERYAAARTTSHAQLWARNGWPPVSQLKMSVFGHGAGGKDLVADPQVPAEVGVASAAATSRPMR